MFFSEVVTVARVESALRSGITTCRVIARGELRTVKLLPIASKEADDAASSAAGTAACAIRERDVLRIRSDSPTPGGGMIPFLFAADPRKPEAARRYHNASTMCREYGIQPAHEIARRVADDRDAADPVHWETYPAEFMEAVCMCVPTGSTSAVNAVLRLVSARDASLRLCVVTLHCLAQRTLRTGDTVFSAQFLSTDVRRFLGQSLQLHGDVARSTDPATFEGDAWQPTPPCWSTQFQEGGRRRFFVIFGAESARRPPHAHVPSGRLACLSSVFRRERVILRWFSPAPPDGPAPMEQQPPPTEGDIVAEVRRFETANACELDATQVRAVCDAFEFSPFVIHGGPGTGKTTIVRCIVHCARAVRGLTCTLLAPTGKAARRLAACTGEPASTLHHFFYSRRGAQTTEDLSDIFILDEASMISTDTMYEFLRCIPADANLILVGDPFQLPPVEPGGVLSDALNMRWIENCRLGTTHRQCAESTGISALARGFEGSARAPAAARLIESLCDAPTMVPMSPWGPGVVYVGCDPADAPRVLCELLRSQPAQVVFASQVLCPGRKTPMGVVAVNQCPEVRETHRWAAHAVLGGPEPGPMDDAHGGVRRLDKVMFTRNKEPVCNGDVYVATEADASGVCLAPADDPCACPARRFPLSRRRYEGLGLEGYSAEHAFAITVHKSQGCEFDTVFLLMDAAFGTMLLDRKLVYTAVTRAKRQLFVIGSAQALAESFGRETRPRATLLGVVAADHRMHERLSRMRMWMPQTLPVAAAAAIRTR